MPSPWPAAESRRGRRALLIGGLGVLAIPVVGCTPDDPVVDGAPGTPPASPTPRPPAPRPGPAFAGAADAARREQAVADGCAALLTGSRGHDLNAATRRRLASVRDAHDGHAAALRSPDPTIRPAGPVPARGREAAEDLHDRTVADALALLVRRERDLAKRHRATAATSRGPAALLWGSLAVAAEAYGRTLAGEGPPVTPAQTPKPVPVLADVSAMQTLVEQLHAVVYGYQVALGQLTGPGEARGRAGLHAVRILRDELAARLAGRSARIPVPAPAYVPSPRVRDADTATTLIRRMETALLPFCGMWLAAAATAGDGQRALAALTKTEQRAAAWGARPSMWPGWPD